MPLRELLDKKPAAQIFEGVSGIKKVYEKILLSNGPLCGFSDLETMGLVMGEGWLWGFAERRAEAGIYFFCLAEKGPLAIRAESRSEKDKRKIKFTEGIVLSTEIYLSNNLIFVLDFNDRCGFVINDLAAAKTLKAIWQMLWDSLT